MITIILIQYFYKKIDVPHVPKTDETIKAIEERMERVPESHSSANKNNETIINDDKKKAEATDVKFRLGVDTFTSKAVERKETIKISDFIAGELIRLKGKECIVRVGGEKQRKNASMLLLGGVEKLGDMYIITARMVDVSRGRTLASFDDTADSFENINAACARIAGNVAKRL